MSLDTFRNVANQLQPHSEGLWGEWTAFAQRTYGVPQTEQSENAFFLYIIPKVVVLHGYGDPLLDPHIPDRVGMLSRRGVPTYFSCNPANLRLIQLWRVQNIFASGLTYIKWSIDSLSDSQRGKDAFAKDYPMVMKLLEMKAKYNYKTQMIITMIDLGRPNQAEEYAALCEMFEGTGVYIYQKSLDQAWMTGKEKPKSIHWSEFCQIPWSSMTIDSSGLSVACEEDYNGEIVLGDTGTQSLMDIWNGEAYKNFRKSHTVQTPGKCWDRCDMKVVGKFL